MCVLPDAFSGSQCTCVSCAWGARALQRPGHLACCDLWWSHVTNNSMGTHGSASMGTKNARFSGLAATQGTKQKLEGQNCACQEGARVARKKTKTHRALMHLGQNSVGNSVLVKGVKVVETIPTWGQDSVTTQPHHWMAQHSCWGGRIIGPLGAICRHQDGKRVLRWEGAQYMPEVAGGSNPVRTASLPARTSVRTLATHVLVRLAVESNSGPWEEVALAAHLAWGGEELAIGLPGMVHAEEAARCGGAAVILASASRGPPVALNHRHGCSAACGRRRVRREGKGGHGRSGADRAAEIRRFGAGRNGCSAAATYRRDERVPSVRWSGGPAFAPPEHERFAREELSLALRTVQGGGFAVLLFPRPSAARAAATSRHGKCLLVARLLRFTCISQPEARAVPKRSGPHHKTKRRR